MAERKGKDLGGGGEVPGSGDIGGKTQENDDIKKRGGKDVEHSEEESGTPGGKGSERESEMGS